MFRKHKRARLGNVCVVTALSLTALLGVAALSLDGGALLTERRQAQAAADAAALAAGCDLFERYWTNNGADPNNKARDAALTAAKANRYDDADADITVSVSIPPATGAYAGKNGYVEVVTEKKTKRALSSIFSSAPVPIRGRAVAVGSPIAADVGILVLDPTSRSSLNSQGGGASTVRGTPVVVNSTNDAAAIAGGGGSLAADRFVLAGGYSTSGGGSFTGAIKTRQQPMEDPLKDIAPPNPDRLERRANNKTQYTSGETRLQPGVYRGGISVSGTGNLLLDPGIYYMDGGGFSFSGQGSLQGLGVMIYNNPGNGNSNGVSVTGQGSMVLTGMTSGPYAGITFFQRRDSTVTGEISGTGGTTSITGTFYFAGALLKINGNGGVANLGSQYISWQLNLGGNGGINIDWRPNTVAQKRSIFLVE